MNTKSVGEENEVCLAMAFRAPKAGTYEVPALDIRVIEWTSERNPAIAAVAPETAAQVLTAGPVTVTVKSLRAPLVAALAAPLLLLGGGLLFWRRRRRDAARREVKESSPEEQGRALLHEARRHRLDGNYYSFYRVLRQTYDLAARVSGRLDERLCIRLDQRIKDTGYRAYRPSEDDLEGDFKEVEQRIGQMNQRP